ncbi:MAG: glycerate kinase [Sedimentisphaeraceae bacterium JB056]
MKIAVLMDSFKGTLSSIEACNAVSEGIRDIICDAEILSVPIADGGEGSIEAIACSLDCRSVDVEVTGPFSDRKVNACFLWLPSTRVAVVEMAKTAGLPLLAENELDPLKATTYGVGELIRAACDLNPSKILLAVGGSCTVDGGIGAAAALGWKFLDSDGRELVYGGAMLDRIVSIVKPEPFLLPPVEVLCDVDNPLLGEKGAARIFGPQKGADEASVELLEKGMSNLAEIVKAKLGMDINVLGAGASGGLAGGAIAFMNASLVSGIDTIADLSNVDKMILDSDIVVTGEGRFDMQSLDGKVVSGIAKRAKKHSKPLYVLAGSLEVPKSKLTRYAITDAIGCVDDEFGIDEVLNFPKQHLKRIASKLASRYMF